MATPEIDPVTGQQTTGHEWDGIKELDSPVPDWWIKTFIICVFIALAGVFLYPAWPLGHHVSKGALDYTDRKAFEAEVEDAFKAQADWRARMAAAPLEEIGRDPGLRQLAIHGGKAAFLQNCAACHGTGAGGQLGQFPSLIDDDWIWGGKVSDIYQTIQHGVRNEDEEARAMVMPAFGDLLSSQDIGDLAVYVKSLSDPQQAVSRQALPGAKIYAGSCTGCHGASGEGNQAVGAPRLNDAIWLYGGQVNQIEAQIARPRMGAMPAFAKRLDDESVKMLAVYVHSLGGGVK